MWRANTERAEGRLQVIPNACWPNFTARRSVNKLAKRERRSRRIVVVASVRATLYDGQRDNQAHDAHCLPSFVIRARTRQCGEHERARSQRPSFACLSEAGARLHRRRSVSLQLASSLSAFPALVAESKQVELALADNERRVLPAAELPAGQWPKFHHHRRRN